MAVSQASRALALMQALLLRRRVRRTRTERRQRARQRKAQRKHERQFSDLGAARARIQAGELFQKHLGVGYPETPEGQQRVLKLLRDNHLGLYVWKGQLGLADVPVSKPEVSAEWVHDSAIAKAVAR